MAYNYFFLLCSILTKEFFVLQKLKLILPLYTLQHELDIRQFHLSYLEMDKHQLFSVSQKATIILNRKDMEVALI